MSTAKNNSPLVSEDGTQRLTRRFLGKTSDFKDRKENNFNKSMLKAYLRGNESFISGMNPSNGQPIYHEVLQEYSYVNI
jgi:hypothetical protein